MDFSREDLEQLFTDYPELILYFVQDSGEQHTRSDDTTESWHKLLYKVAHSAYNDIRKNKILLAQFPLFSSLFAHINIDKRSGLLEQTCLSLLSLKQIIARQQKEFTSFAVIEGEPLDVDQFTQLSDMFYALNEDATYTQQSIELNLLINGLSRIIPVRERLDVLLNLCSRDPKLFFHDLISLPEEHVRRYFPSLAKTSSAIYAFIQNANLGFDCGHFIHAECGVNAVIRLKDKLDLQPAEQRVSSLISSVLSHIVDIAGVHRQDNKRLLNNKLYSRYMDRMLPYLLQLSEHDGATVQMLYHNQFFIDVGLLSTDGMTNELLVEPYKELNFTLLSRLLCMLNIYEKESALKIKAALVNLCKSAKGRTLLRNYFTIVGEEENKQWFQTPTNMPGLLNALVNCPHILTLSEEGEQGHLDVAVRLYLQLYTQIIKQYLDRCQRRRPLRTTPISFNALADMVGMRFEEFAYTIRRNGAFSFAPYDNQVYSANWLNQNNKMLKRGLSLLELTAVQQLHFVKLLELTQCMTSFYQQPFNYASEALQWLRNTIGDHWLQKEKENVNVYNETPNARKINQHIIKQIIALEPRYGQLDINPRLAIHSIAVIFSSEIEKTLHVLTGHRRASESFSQKSPIGITRRRNTNEDERCQSTDGVEEQAVAHYLHRRAASK